MPLARVRSDRAVRLKPAQGALVYGSGFSSVCAVVSVDLRRPYVFWPTVLVVRSVSLCLITLRFAGVSAGCLGMPGIEVQYSPLATDRPVLQ